MANIKVSELSEVTTSFDGDTLMIVQANENKRISKQNFLKELTNKGFIAYTIPNTTATLSANSWQDMGTTQTITLENGIWLLIYSAVITSATNGIATIRSMFDGTENVYERSTIPVGSGLTCSTQIINTSTIASNGEHTINMQVYSNVPVNVSALRIKMFKIN